MIFEAFSPGQWVVLRTRLQYPLLQWSEHSVLIKEMTEARQLAHTTHPDYTTQCMPVVGDFTWAVGVILFDNSSSRALPPFPTSLNAAALVANVQHNAVVQRLLQYSFLDVIACLKYNGLAGRRSLHWSTRRWRGRGVCKRIRWTLSSAGSLKSTLSGYMRNSVILQTQGTRLLAPTRKKHVSTS